AAAAPLRARASVVRAPRFDAAYPARYGAAVEARLTSGAALRAEAPDALGDPDNPISQDALIAKARALIEDGGRSPAQADRLIEAALALPKGGALRAFAAALAEAPAP
ncbi:MAG: MmgE/PrpD family protein, partial [Pseudomonadota bacterium]